MNLSKFSNLFLFALVSLFSTSCEEVIDMDLKNAEKKYVIEAVLTDHPGDAAVWISRTKDLDDNNEFSGVSGAIVTIQEGNNIPVKLSETTTGKYTSSLLAGSSGKTYELVVSIGGNQFTALSTMPAKVNLDTIYVTDEFLFSDTKKIMNAEYRDPAGKGNNFRHVQYINNKKETQLFISNDDYTDGRLNTNKLFYFSDDDDDKGIQPGDTVRIDMQCIDPVIFKYWFSVIRSATGSADQATPANPVTNIKGGALGYFSAHTTQTKEMVIP